jgi:hypothetical protein
MSIVQLRRVLVLAPREATVEGLKFVDLDLDLGVEVAMFAEEVSGCLFAAIIPSSQIRVDVDVDLYAGVVVHV